MKYFLSNVLSAFLGAILVVVIMVGFDKLSTIYPIYIPNIFYKDRINVSVNVESVVSEAIENASDNVVQVNNYLGTQIRGTGSGVIYKLTEDKAYIVTNYHVVENASKVEIETASGYKVFGEILGTDNVTDLAVITIPKGLIDHYIEFSDSEALKVGEYVIAIGNPLGLSGSATLGILSSRERLVPVDIDNDNENDTYASVLQTDAAINPGNSGGALINLNGNLIGINSMKIAESDVEGIGFSIPSNLVVRIIAELETHGSVNRPTRLLGIQIQTLPSNGKIIYEIHEVVKDSLAEINDLRKGDVIIEINGQDIKNHFDLKYYLSNTAVGETITLTINRGSETLIKEILVTK